VHWVVVRLLRRKACKAAQASSAVTAAPGIMHSRARHHVVVSGGSWSGPETHAFCVSHVSSAQAHVAVVSKDSVSTPLLN